MPATKTPTARLSVTLADGTVYAYDVVKMPRAWKSWVMQQVPYGTEFFGCTWSRVRL